MAGLDPATHALTDRRPVRVDGRVKPGHDSSGCICKTILHASREPHFPQTALREAGKVAPRSGDGRGVVRRSLPPNPLAPPPFKPNTDPDLPATPNPTLLRKATFPALRRRFFRAISCTSEAS